MKTRCITCFGHADTTVNNGKCVVGLVRDESNEKLWLSIELALVRKALESNFIQSLYKQIITNRNEIPEQKLKAKRKG